MAITLDDETERFAHRLAVLRQEGVEQAVRIAVREALTRAEQEAAGLAPEQQAKVDRMLAKVKALPPLPGDDGDPTAGLHDGYGLPH